MKIDLDRKGLETLVKGSQLYYSDFDNKLVKKAGHDYRDSTGGTSWSNLKELTENELYDLYIICRNSWL